MIKKLGCIAVGILASWNAFATDITCSNSTGKLTYVLHEQVGGPYPPPGTVVGYARWTLNGKVLDSYKIISQETTGFTKIRVSESDQVSLKKTMNGPSEIEIYAEDVSIMSNVPAPFMPVLIATDFVVCTRTDVFIP